MRKDGKVTYYTLQFYHEDLDRWVIPNFDYFGYPPEFNASSECWQLYGHHGVLKKKKAKKALKWIKIKQSHLQWRLIRITRTKKTEIL